MNSKLVVLVALFVCASLADDLSATPEVFVQFMQQYGKSYSHDQFYYRYRVFQQNVARINELNNDPEQQATFAINQFSDLSLEEFQAMYLMPKFNPAATCKWPWKDPAKVDTTNLAPQFDWRTQGAVSSVKNQGGCGSCWAFSTAANVEGQWFLGKNALTDVSEQWIVDCSKSCLASESYLCNAGCGGGLPWLAYNDIITHKFITTETAYPYLGYDSTCKDPTPVGARISNWTYAAKDEASIEALLATQGPLSITLNANLLFSYSAGIITGQVSSCDPSGSDHAVLLVGYDTTTNPPYWIVKNSWGTTWGEQGFFRIQANNDLCGVFDCVTTALL